MVEVYNHRYGSSVMAQLLKQTPQQSAEQRRYFEPIEIGRSVEYWGLSKLVVHSIYMKTGIFRHSEGPDNEPGAFGKVDKILCPFSLGACSETNCAMVLVVIRGCASILCVVAAFDLSVDDCGKGPMLGRVWVW